MHRYYGLTVPEAAVSNGRDGGGDCNVSEGLPIAKGPPIDSFDGRFDYYRGYVGSF